MFVEIILVVLVGRIIVLQRQQLDLYRFVVLALLLGKHSLNHRFLLRRGVIHARAITCTCIVTLPVQRQRIDSREEHLHQKRKAHRRFVVADPYRFRITRSIGIDLLVRGSRQIRTAVGKTRLSSRDAMNLLEEMFGAPEATAGEINLLHFY